MPPTQYHIAQVDSFSMGSGGFFASSQFTIKMDIPLQKYKQTFLIAGLGVGTNAYSHQFSAPAEFTKSRVADIVANGAHANSSGVYLVPLIGIAHRHHLGKILLQHTFSANILFPVFLDSGTGSTDREYLGILSRLNDPLALQKSTIEQTLFYSEYNNKKVLFGLEYQPEWIFNSRRKGPVLFYALGFVFNYSWGDLMRGKVIVDNDRTRYEGWATQGFSKIGLTFRVGWDFEKNRAQKKKT